MPSSSPLPPGHFTWLLSLVLGSSLRKGLEAVYRAGGVRADVTVPIDHEGSLAAAYGLRLFRDWQRWTFGCSHRQTSFSIQFPSILNTTLNTKGNIEDATAILALASSSNLGTL